MNRRTFAFSSAAAMLTGATHLLAQQPTSSSTPATRPGQSAPLPAAMVKEFVAAAHVNLEKTKSMLASEPGLVNATWDWGGGDFEQAIGGAGHMGRKDIAEFLISQGARMDIFVAAMMGDLVLVKEYLKAHPDHVRAKGPHAIPLIEHAQEGLKNGVKEAEAVVQFLKSVQQA